MFPASFKKFYGVMVISLVLGFGAMSAIQGPSITGMAVASSSSSGSATWPVFFAGLAIGCIAAFGFVSLIFYEKDRL